MIFPAQNATSVPCKRESHHVLKTSAKFNLFEILLIPCEHLPIDWTLNWHEFLHASMEGTRVPVLRIAKGCQNCCT